MPSNRVTRSAALLKLHVFCVQIIQFKGAKRTRRGLVIVCWLIRRKATQQISGKNSESK